MRLMANMFVRLYLINCVDCRHVDSTVGCTCCWPDETCVGPRIRWNGPLESTLIPMQDYRVGIGCLPSSISLRKMIVRDLAPVPCVYNVIVILNLPIERHFSFDRWFLSCRSVHTYIRVVARLDRFELFLVVGDAAWGYPLESENSRNQRLHPESCSNVYQVRFGSYWRTALVWRCVLLFLLRFSQVVFCSCICNTACNIETAFVVGKFFCGFARHISLVGFDIGFDPSEKRHYCLLEASPSFELCVDS